MILQDPIKVLVIGASMDSSLQLSIPSISFLSRPNFDVNRKSIMSQPKTTPTDCDLAVDALLDVELLALVHRKKVRQLAVSLPARDNVSRRLEHR